MRYEIEAKLERGVALPAWFLDEPPLIPFTEFFMKHFWVLDSERPIGWTQGRIPESKVAGYAFRLALPSDMIELFIQVILELDRDYLRWVNEQREKKANKEKGGS